MENPKENTEASEETPAFDNLEESEESAQITSEETPAEDNQTDATDSEPASEETVEETEVDDAAADNADVEEHVEEDVPSSNEETSAESEDNDSSTDGVDADGTAAEDSTEAESGGTNEEAGSSDASDEDSSDNSSDETSEAEANLAEKSEEEAEAEPKEKKPFPFKAVGIACGCVAGALVAAYAGGAIYFSSHFMPNTTVNGEDVSMKSVTELASDIDNRLATMSPSITGMGVNLTFAANDVNIQVDSEAFAKSALQQEDNLAWPLEVFSSHELTANYPVTYNKGTLTKLVHNAIEEVNKDGKEPQNAEISYDKKQKAYAVVAGDAGTLIEESTVISAVDSKFQILDGTITLSEENLKKPQITADNKRLVNAVEEANSYITKTITFKSGDKELFDLDGDIMKEWVTISEDFDVVYDEEVARDWLENNLRAKVDTAGSTRKYKREDGETVEVTGGTYGWAFTLDGVNDKVLKKVKNKKGGSIKLKTIKEGSIWNPGGKDWDGKYIDIDLGDQYARLYDKKGKVIWESDVVSGNTSAGNGTPTGVYVINSYMARNVTLVSSQRDKKGKPTYESPVSYWMPFVDNSVGLHDATWRSEFGGGIYTYNGSHGCVNLPYSKAASLYELIEPGIVVSCHY